MGGTPFIVTGDGPDAETAFRAVRTAAQFAHGHGGYTGTIAEKDDCILFDLPAGVELDPARFAAWVVNNSTEDVDELPFCPPESRELLRQILGTSEDKWGPACAFRTGPTSFVFFGWASS